MFSKHKTQKYRNNVYTSRLLEMETDGKKERDLMRRDVRAACARVIMRNPPAAWERRGCVTGSQSPVEKAVSTRLLCAPDRVEKRAPHQQSSSSSAASFCARDTKQ